MNNEWYTPQWLFDELNEEYSFTLDPCGCLQSHMCDKYYSISDDGLSKDWSDEVVFMNPPYDRSLYQWVKKAYDSFLCGAKVVCLLPARTDTKWFHEFCLKGKVVFLRGRLRFSNACNNAPFPSMLVFFV